MAVDDADSAQGLVSADASSSLGDDANRMNGAAVALAALILIVGIWFVYGRILDQAFIFDDLGSVLENTSIRQLRPLFREDGPLNSRNHLVGRRPLASLSLAINYRLGGLDPAGYHLFSIVVHIATALLLFLLVSRTLQLSYIGGKFSAVADPLALFVALVWALHPLVTEGVAYVTQRTELMMAFCYLATLYCSLGYWGAKSSGARSLWLTLASLACLMGAGSKEVIVTAPVIVVLFERTFIAGSFGRALRNSWPLYVGLMLSWAWLAALAVYGPNNGAAGFGLGIPVIPYWATQARVLLMYMRLAIWPAPLVIHYDVPLFETVSAALPSVLAVTALGIVTIVLVARRTAIGFLAASVFLILSPTMVIPMSDEVAAERRMYLPLAAIVSLVVVGGYAIAQDVFRKVEAKQDRAPAVSLPLVATAGCAVLLTLVFAIMSISRLRLYGDDVALWQDALAHQSQDWMVQANLASALNNAGRPKEAVPHFQEAIRLKPERADLHYKLGIALSRTGQTRDAIEQFNEALQASPDSAVYRHELGATLLNAGESEKAIEQFRESLRRDPQAVASRDLLATALLNADRSQEAVEQFELVLKAEPDRPTVKRKLAIALAKMGQSEAAIKSYEQSLHVAADTAVERFFLGHALATAGNLEGAIVEFKNALRMAPDAAQIRYELAMTLAKLDRDGEAIEQFQRVLQAQPDNAEVYLQLATTHAKANRLPEAITAAETGLKYARAQNQPELANKLEALLIDYRGRAIAP